MNKVYHTPVMLKECMEALAINPGGTYVDTTFGGGGHSRGILERLNEEGSLIAFDQDAAAEGNTINDDRFKLVHANFRHLKRFLALYVNMGIDGVLADLGVSSHQFDTDYRGFSFRFDSELDMRMDTHQLLTAQKVVDTYSAEKLQIIFGEYGEVRNSKTLAETIVSRRTQQKMTSTQDFVKTIEPCIRGERTSYLAQVFQALRMEVNDELNALNAMLDQAYEVLRPGGRLVVLTYHSIEDRVVKQKMKSLLNEESEATDVYGHKEYKWLVITRKPLLPGEDELKENSRSRSAKLRIAEKAMAKHN